MPILFGLVAVFCLGGCSTTSLNVTAMRFGEEPARQSTFRVSKPTIAVANGSVDADKLAGYVNTALLNGGFASAPAGNPPGMVIDVLFEQEPARLETRIGTESIYQWQPEQTVLTTRQTKTSTGLVFTEAMPKKVAAHSEAVGSRAVSYLVKVFPKRLRIVGRKPAEPSASEAGQPLWIVEVRNDSEARDLGRCALHMVAAAMDYLGDDFSGSKTVFISSDDKRTRILRKSGLPDGKSGA